jgi:hypothetical protein
LQTAVDPPLNLPEHRVRRLHPGGVIRAHPAAVATGILFLASRRPLANAIAYAAAFGLAG